MMFRPYPTLRPITVTTMTICYVRPHYGTLVLIHMGLFTRTDIALKQTSVLSGMCVGCV